MNTTRDANVNTADEVAQADALRGAMIAELRELGAIPSDRVAAAVGAVPRHLFASGKPLEAVYAPIRAIVTKRNEHGAAISSLSESHIQATMLEQAQLEPGMRVLEIGTGGYNAALIAELAGESGKIVSVDIDPEIVDRVRDCLAAADTARSMWCWPTLKTASRTTLRQGRSGRADRDDHGMARMSAALVLVEPPAPQHNTLAS